MKQINFTLDGKKVAADASKSILAAAREHGVEIPALCQNGKISKTTSCFVCVVRDLKTGRFLPSCSACPTEGQEIDASSPEVLDMRKTALNLLLSEHSGDCEAPCTIACPAHAAVEEYVRAGRQGDFKKALQIIKQRIPLPLSIGRVCPRFCEKDCRKNITGKPVAINDFKRLAADLFYEECYDEPPSSNGRKVAVVGAGPAGLSAAYFLRGRGYETTVFERMPEAGGMLRYGIPEFRLPKKILGRELALLTKMGVKIKHGSELGKDITVDGLKKDFDAVVIAVGCWKASSMGVNGEDLAKDGIKWLEDIASNNYKFENPGKTIVVGGGNTAMDCSRVALRLGSKDVSCFYRRTEKEMPAEHIEVEEAMEEGVKFHFLTAPTALKRGANGKLVLTCVKMELGEPDASGRRKPVPVKGSEYDTEADTVVAAIGQGTAAIAGLKTDRRGNVQISAADAKMEDKVFAAGDCVTGAATVVEAVAGGRKAALAVMAMFEKDVVLDAGNFNVSRGHWRSMSKDDVVYVREVSENERVKVKYIPMDKRQSSFGEISPTFGEDDMSKEGERCIECSCSSKKDCKLKELSVCAGASPDAIKGAKLKPDYDHSHPLILHDKGKCVKCGVCVKICAEVVDKHIISMKKRGFLTSVGAAFGKPLPLLCSECGACIEECPTGALEWKSKKD
jgi:formate dehydrogenase major subunit